MNIQEQIAHNKLLCAFSEMSRKLGLAESLRDYWRNRAERTECDLEAVREALMATQGTLTWTQTALEGVQRENGTLRDERDALKRELLRRSAAEPFSKFSLKGPLRRPFF